MFKFFQCIISFIFMLILSVQAQAELVEYRFSGVLTGNTGVQYFGNSVSLIDAQFHISIYGDTDNAFRFGSIAGTGTCYINNSVNAKWEIEGFGTAMSSDAQMYSLPGRVGFGWNGKVFPLNTDTPAQLVLSFGSNTIALDSNYYQLGNTVDATAVWLSKSLQNPPGMVPLYSTYINIGGSGLLLKEISNVSYSVVAAPLPASLVLLGSALAGLAAVRRRERNKSIC